MKEKKTLHRLSIYQIINLLMILKSLSLFFSITSRPYRQPTNQYLHKHLFRYIKVTQVKQPVAKLLLPVFPISISDIQPFKSETEASHSTPIIIIKSY